AQERGLTVDAPGYSQLMEAARQRSREGAGTQRDIHLPPEAITQLKYGSIKASEDLDKFHGRPVTATVRAIWNGRDFDEILEDSECGSEFGIITDRTSFYSESGGQVGDTGSLRDNDSDHSEFEVTDTQAFGGYVLHVGKIVRGRISVGESMQMAIDHDRRELIKANHTTTHLLNHALREVLGEEIQQKGSLVAADRLRFDFSFSHAMSVAQIDEVQRLVNEGIEKSMAVHALVVPLDAAQKVFGVRAVFGERYPDPVRVVSIGVPVEQLIADPDNKDWIQHSVEFCGGTHLDHTKAAGQFVIVHEQSPASGVRRITALTGPAALAAQEAARELESRFIRAAQDDDEALIRQFDELVPLIDELTIGVAVRHKLQTELVEPMRERVRTLRKKTLRMARDTIVDQARQLIEHEKGPIIVHHFAGADQETLRSALDAIRARLPESAAMLFSTDQTDSKVTIVAAVPKALIDKGLKAGDWVREAARICGGGGGGRPDMAQAGGKLPDKVPDAINAARDMACRAIE
ncbi:MAG: hypothetical protein HRT46_12035, partial [Deltaproteobacteria bacterium]|nr:hypothetical protein [Deltaproteobacteria bacterium]